MAQELGKMNMSPILRKMSFLLKNLLFFEVSIFGEIQFSRKILSHSKNQPYTLAQQVPTQQTPIIFCCFYKPPRSGPHQVRNCREATVPGKETKSLKEGADQTFQTRYSSFLWYA